MTAYKTVVLTLTLALTVAASGGCGYLPQLPGSGAGGALKPPIAPRVSVGAVALVNSPTNADLTGYFCPQVAPALVCRMLAPAPRPEAMKFVFDVSLDVENPNTIPLPMVEAMAAFTVFPGRGQQNLGAVCLSMCQDPQSCPTRADACSERGPNVRTLEDFAMATAGFLFNVATGQASVENLRIKTIPAGGTTRVTFRLELDATAVLRLMRTLQGEAMNEIARRRTPRFEIPYTIEGSVWIQVEGFAKIGAPFPAQSGTWQLL